MDGGLPIFLDGNITLCARADLSATRFFSGRVAELSLYNSALTSAQVHTPIQAGGPPPPSSPVTPAASATSACSSPVTPAACRSGMQPVISCCTAHGSLGSLSPFCNLLASQKMRLPMRVRPARQVDNLHGEGIAGNTSFIDRAPSPATQQQPGAVP